MPKKLTHDEYVAKVTDSSKGTIIVLSEYKGSKEQVTVKHTECGRVYPVNAESVSKRGVCKFCRYKTQKKRKTPTTISDFKKEVEEITDGDYVCVGTEFVNARTPIMVKHISCDRAYPVTPSDFREGKRCKKCSSAKAGLKRRKSHDKFCQEVLELEHGEYEVLTEYTRECDHVTLRHVPCGHVYPVRANSFLAGRRCPECNASHGEKLVRDNLLGRGVDFEEQVTFGGLKLKKPLSYDFFLPKEKVLIEYQGKQHYEPIERFGGDSAFKIQLARDNVKRQYALDNGIKLIEVPYTVTEKSQLDKLLNQQLFRKS